MQIFVPPQMVNQVHGALSRIDCLLDAVVDATSLELAQKRQQDENLLQFITLLYLSTINLNVDFVGGARTANTCLNIEEGWKFWRLLLKLQYVILLQVVVRRVRTYARLWRW